MGGSWLHDGAGDSQGSAHLQVAKRFWERRELIVVQGPVREDEQGEATQRHTLREDWRGAQCGHDVSAGVGYSGTTVGGLLYFAIICRLLEVKHGIRTRLAARHRGIIGNSQWSQKKEHRQRYRTS